MKRLLFTLLTTLAGISAFAQLSVSQLKTEHLTNPVGIGEKRPLMSWIITDPSRRSVMQSAYEIIVKDGNSTVWSTGKVTSGDSAGVIYAGEELTSATRYTWQVRVWDDRGKVSKWSGTAFWHTGLFDKSDWQARWIKPASTDERAVYFRKTFRLAKPVSCATLYITAHGIYEAGINGKSISADMLTPGWTAYKKRLQYQAYDITPLLSRSDNAIGVTVAKGWYLSKLPWSRKTSYGDEYGLLAQVMVKYKDGTSEVIATDDSWKNSTGEVRYDNLYDGETLDLQYRQKGWDTYAFDDSGWMPSMATDTPMDNLVATVSPAVRVIETFKPVKLIITPKGDKVIDFGQNISGRERIHLRGAKGDTVRIYHAEVLDEKGEFFTANLRKAKAISTYILSGEGEEWFAPHFAFYGFRYIKVEGIGGELNLDDFVAEAITSDIPDAGVFTTSDPEINRLQSNIVWGMRDNFVDIPTDCPQRDERLGWTGDAQVFFRTSSFISDVQTFFSKWLADLAADQYEDGSVSGVIPVTHMTRISAGWGDAATIIPWQHYMAYGDVRILKNQYQSMKGWVDYIYSQTDNHLWNGGHSYGDWVYFSYADDRDGRSAVTSRAYIQQCFYLHSLGIMVKTAELLGNTADASHYSSLRKNALDAFMNEYVTPNGMLVSDTQTAYTLALEFDLLPEAMRAGAAARLAENVRSYGHITTGFLGTPYICHALTRFGYADVAYKLLLNKKIPSWLYEVSMGATTIWERWNSMLPDGSIINNSMNSFNHYAYGAIGDWLYRESAGLQETAPGFRSMMIRPRYNDHFDHVSAGLETPYGYAFSEWAKTPSGLKLTVEIPCNTTAEVYIPSGEKDDVHESGRSVKERKDMQFQGWEDGYTRVSVGSGRYEFSVAGR